MIYKNFKKIFEKHNEARDYFAKNPNLLIEGSKLIQKEFVVVKGRVDILLKKDNIFYLIEVKKRGSLYEARKQLRSYGSMFERFNNIFSKETKLNYIIIKLQKYLGTDIYYYDNIDDLMKRTDEYSKIHNENSSKILNSKEIKEKWKKNWDNSQDKWKDKWENSKGKMEENWKKSMEKLKKEKIKKEK